MERFLADSLHAIKFLFDGALVLGEQSAQLARGFRPTAEGNDRNETAQHPKVMPLEPDKSGAQLVHDELFPRSWASARRPWLPRCWVRLLSFGPSSRGVGRAAAVANRIESQSG